MSAEQPQFLLGVDQPAPQLVERNGQAIQTFAVPGPGSNAEAQAVPVYYIDPSNSWPGGPWSPTSVQTGAPGSGKASDTNTGTSADAPLLTVGEIFSRMGTHNPTLNGITGMTLIFLSDEPDATIFNDPVDITAIANQVDFVVVGTPKVIATGTIGTYTSRFAGGSLGYQTGVLDNFTSPQIPDFTPFTDLMVQTSSGATMWISPDETTANFPATSAFVSAPMQTIVPGTPGSFPGTGAFLAPGDGSAATSVAPPPWVTPAPGDTFNIVQPCRVSVTRLQFDLSSSLAHIPSNGVGLRVNGMIMQNIWVPIPPPNPGAAFTSGQLVGESIWMQQCRIDAATSLELGIWRTSKSNCDFTDLVSGNSRYYGGIYIFGGPLQNFFGQTLDGDIVTRFGVVELAPIQVIFGTVYAGIYSQAAFGTQIVGSPGNGVNGNPGDVYYLSPSTGPSSGGPIFFCPPASGPGPNSPQLWGQNVECDLFQGAALQICNSGPGITAGACFPSINAPAEPAAFTVDGVGGGSQIAKYSAGVWTPFAGPLNTGSLDALNPGGNTPKTASVQNPDTGSRIVFNGGFFPFN